MNPEDKSHRGWWTVLLALGVAEAVVLLLRLVGALNGQLVQHSAFHLLALGYATVWALFPLLARLPRAASGVLAFGIMAGAGFGGSSLLDAWGMDGAPRLVTVYAAASLFAVGATAWACRKEFTARRFMAVLYVCTVVFCMIGMSAILAPTPILIIVAAPIGGWLMGSFSYFVLVPFVLLAFWSPYYHSHFKRILGVDTREHEIQRAH